MAFSGVQPHLMRKLMVPAWARARGSRAHSARVLVSPQAASFKLFDRAFWFTSGVTHWQFSGE